MVGAEAQDINAEDWKEKKARKIVEALLDAKIGHGLAKDPEVTALALQMLNSRLPGALVRQWCSGRLERRLGAIFAGHIEPQPTVPFVADAHSKNGCVLDVLLDDL